MKLHLCMMVLATLMSACSSLPGVRTNEHSVASTRSAPDRLIVVAVANPPGTVMSRAGSTPRGYDRIPRYAEGSIAKETLSELADEYGLHEVAGWPIASLHVHCVVFEIPQHASREEVLARLTRDPRVNIAQPLQTFATRGAAYNDPYLSLQHGFEEIHAADAHELSRGKGVKVAIIDTGVDTGHPDLSGRLASERNFVDDDVSQFDKDIHGTEIAGIIAADANNSLGIVGIAPEVGVIALKACWQLEPQGAGAQCNSFTLAQALEYAIGSGAQIVNLSLGGPADPLLEELVKAGLKRGIIFVGAVPPDGHVDGFPVGIPGVIAVEVADRPVLGHALHAPGKDILTLTPGGHYDFASGSSLSTAHVTGIIALLLTEDRNLDAPAIYELLVRSESGVVAAASSSGTVNACVALVALRPGKSCGSSRMAGLSGTSAAVSATARSR